MNYAFDPESGDLLVKVPQREIQWFRDWLNDEYAPYNELDGGRAFSEQMYELQKRLQGK